MLRGMEGVSDVAMTVPLEVKDGRVVTSLYLAISMVRSN